MCFPHRNIVIVFCFHDCVGKSQCSATSEWRPKSCISSSVSEMFTIFLRVRILHALYIFHTWFQVEAGVFVWFHTCWCPWFDSEHGQENFLYFEISRPTLKPTQTLIHCVRYAVSLVMKRSGRILSARLYLVPRLRMSGMLTSLPHTSS
jgi:hypothetical protein